MTKCNNLGHVTGQSIIISILETIWNTAFSMKFLVLPAEFRRAMGFFLWQLPGSRAPSLNRSKLLLLAAVHSARTRRLRLAVTWSRVDGCAGCRHVRRALSEERWELSDKIMSLCTAMQHIIYKYLQHTETCVKRKRFYRICLSLYSHPTRWSGGPCHWAGPGSCP